MGYGGNGKGWGGDYGYGMYGMNPMMMWGFGKGKGKGKGKRNGLKADPSLKVWIGNIADSVDWKALQAHLDTAGKTKWVEAFKGEKSKGTGAAVYSTAEEVANAVLVLNGSSLGGQSLVIDAWEKAPKEA
eukprot:TRINITY_DN40159_c0_g1_i1.p1 TRINITY_DN40159_c0_g1~~TRINITY_DN40159_c0_g1_i1.p1  ORF type:complete len:130 (+),score=40.82 TRINITY_DN40159_c0_g1_i1:81-470(+)